MTSVRSFVVVASMLVSTSALAQTSPVNPVVPAPPMMRPIPGVSVEGDLYAAIPGDDIADAVDTSGGIRGAVRYSLTPNISVHGAFRFIVVNVKDVADNVDVTYFDVGLGARYTLPLNPLVSLYGEAELLASQVRVSAGPFSDTDHDPGFATRIGGLFAIAPRIDLCGFIGVTKNFAGDDPDDQDSRWIDLGAGAVFYL